MSAKEKKTATSNKKLDKKSNSKQLLDQLIPKENPEPVLDADYLRKKPITSQDLLVEYDYLSIQPLESFYIIEAMKADLKNIAQSMLSQNLIPSDFSFSNPAKQHTAEDAAALKDIFASMIVDAAEYGYRVGFRPYQLSIWLTINTKMLIEAIDKMKSSSSCSASNITLIINQLFLQYSTRQEQNYGSIPLFTLGEYKGMIDFLKTGLLMHFNLFKFALSNPQDLVIFKVTRKFDLATFPIESMSSAINEADWPAYCKEQEEKELKLIQEELDKEQARINSEVEKLENEKAEIQTNLIKARLAEAEKAMLAPLEPFLIPPPPLPTVEQIFRKQIVTKPEEFFDTFVEETKLQPEGTTSASGSANSKKKKSQSNTVVPESIVPIKKKAVKDLPPPPDMSISKPLEKKKISSPEPAPIVLAPVFTPIITTVEYINIPLEQRLSRQEAADIVSASVMSAVEEYKKWVLKVIKWEEDQWESRLAALQKARSDRDADLALQKEREKLTNPNTAAKPKSKK